MQSSGSSDISRVRFVGSLEGAELNRLAVFLYLCAPFLGALFVTDALSAARIVATKGDICSIPAWISGPESAPTIIARIAVSMVHYGRGPLTGHIKEGESACHILSATHVYVNISATPSRSGWGVLCPPIEQPSFRLVPEHRP